MPQENDQDAGSNFQFPWAQNLVIRKNRIFMVLNLSLQ